MSVRAQRALNEMDALRLNGTKVQILNSTGDGEADRAGRCPSFPPGN